MTDKGVFAGSILLAFILGSCITSTTSDMARQDRGAPRVHQHHPSSSTSTSSTSTSSSSSTTKSNINTKDEKIAKALEATMLRMMGMKSRPARKHQGSGKVHVPPYLMRLYKHHVNQPGELSGFSANTIRSFQPHDKGVREFLHSDPNKVHLRFNVSSLMDAENLKHAELRLFRHLDGDHVAGGSDVIRRRHRIDIHEVVQPASVTREAITRLIDTRVVVPKNSTWETFDVNPAVLKWRQSPQDNHGLLVHFVTEHGEPSSLKHHVRLRRSVKYEKDWNKQQPLLVTYSDDGKAPVGSRSRSRSRSRTRKKRSRNKNARRSRRTRPRKRKRPRNTQCQRHSLYVDFQDVGWNDWIVAPPGYYAYFCHGECPYPLADHLNSTNHAIVQTLVNSINDQAAPTACCVPTTLTSISMLYVDENDQIVLKNYNDMVVEGCGCR